MIEAASTINGIGAVEAIELLTADISGREFEEARAAHPAWPAAAAANVEQDEVSEINVERDFIGEVLARPAAKRELALTLLTAALCNGALLIWVQLSATGARIQITATNLRTTALLRESIVAGIIRAFPDEYLARHDGEELLLSRAEFLDWLRHRPRPEPVEAIPEAVAVALAATVPAVKVPDASTSVDQLPSTSRTTDAGEPTSVQEADDERLSSAIKRQWEAGQRPASTVTWIAFCDSIRDNIDGWIGDRKHRKPKRGLGDRSIGRRVDALKQSGQLS